MFISWNQASCNNLYRYFYNSCTPSPNQDQDLSKIPIATLCGFLFWGINCVKKHKNKKNCNLSFWNIWFFVFWHFWAKYLKFTISWITLSTIFLLFLLYPWSHNIVLHYYNIFTYYKGILTQFWRHFDGFLGQNWSKSEKCKLFS